MATRHFPLAPGFNVAVLPLGDSYAWHVYKVGNRRVWYGSGEEETLDEVKREAHAALERTRREQSVGARDARSDTRRYVIYARRSDGEWVEVGTITARSLAEAREEAARRRPGARFNVVPERMRGAAARRDRRKRRKSGSAQARRSSRGSSRRARDIAVFQAIGVYADDASLERLERQQNASEVGRDPQQKRDVRTYKIVTRDGREASPYLWTRRQAERIITRSGRSDLKIQRQRAS